MTTVWLNGAFVEPGDARVSVFDSSIQHAVGLFETMQARDGHVFRLGAHLRRIAGSAVELGLAPRIAIEPLAEAIQATVERAGLDRARVRLTITRGALDLRLPGAPESERPQPTILIVAQPSVAYPEELFEQGIGVIVSDDRVNPLDAHAGHKTIDYWRRLAILQLAATRGASEALWFSVSNHLACACTSNIFLVRDQVLLTPVARGEEAEGALRAPVLPGVTREAVLEVAREEGMPVDRRLLTIEDVVGADELFLTNSGWGAVPVVRVERERIGDGSPGPVFATLRAGLERSIDRECRIGLDLSDDGD